MTNCRRINALMTGVLLGSIAGIATLDADALGAEEASVTLSPKALEEIGQVETEIDRIEAQTLERLVPPPDNQVQQIELLGKALLYDKNLSVNRNQACAFCHMPETGFTGPISELNRTTGSYPGSVRTRFSQRTPQTHAYAPLAPVCTTIPARAISLAAISGTCARPADVSATPPLNKPRDRPPSSELVPLQFRMPPEFVRAFKQEALNRGLKLNGLLELCFHDLVKK